MKKSPSLLILSLLCILSLALLMSGCAANKGDVTQTTTWVAGIDVETANSANGTPNVRLGIVKTTQTRLPTSTNGPIFSPRYASSFHSKQNAWNPLSMDCVENMMAGEASIGTNSEMSAVIPKGPPPSFFQSLAPNQ